MTRIQPCELELFIRDGDVIPYFQPIIDMRTGTCCGAEVLARLRHPGEGILTPAHFISHNTPAALLSALTQALMAEVERKLNLICLPARFMLTFNIVPETLSEPWLAQACQSLLDKKVSVILELTEQRPLTGDMARFGREISRLQEAGVRLAIDDFGTGHAGLSMLMHSGGDYLKIPREFVSASADNPRAGCVIGNILHLADMMRMRVIAEGVESRDQVEQLFSMGISLLQGAYFSMPLSFNDFIRYLRQFPEKHADDVGKGLSGSALSPALLLYCAKRHGLSPRETEVIISTVQGTRLEMISATASRSVKTLSAQKRNAYRKIGVKNDVGLIHYLYWLNEYYRSEAFPAHPSYRAAGEKSLVLPGAVHEHRKARVPAGVDPERI